MCPLSTRGGGALRCGGGRACEQKLNIPDYLDVIKTPMDFGTVCDRLEQRAYGSAAEWAADVRLTLHNAMAYNGPENQIHIMAKELEGVFGALLSRLPPGSLDASN